MVLTSHYVILPFFTVYYFYYCLLLFITVYYLLLLFFTVYYFILPFVTFLYCLLLHIIVCYLLPFWAVQPTLLGCPAHPFGGCPAHFRNLWAVQPTHLGCPAHPCGLSSPQPTTPSCEDSFFCQASVLKLLHLLSRGLSSQGFDKNSWHWTWDVRDNIGLELTYQKGPEHGCPKYRGAHKSHKHFLFNTGPPYG